MVWTEGNYPSSSQMNVFSVTRKTLPIIHSSPVVTSGYFDSYDMLCISSTCHLHLRVLIEVKTSNVPVEDEERS